MTIRVVRVDDPDPDRAWSNWMALIERYGGLMVYLRDDVESIADVESEWSGSCDPKRAYIFDVIDDDVVLDTPSSYNGMRDEYVVKARAFYAGI